MDVVPFVDGDWMLYLSLGTVICKATDEGSSVSIIFLNPDGEAIMKRPSHLSSDEVRLILNDSKR